MPSGCRVYAPPLQMWVHLTQGHTTPGAEAEPDPGSLVLFSQDCTRPQGTHVQVCRSSDTQLTVLGKINQHTLGPALENKTLYQPRGQAEGSACHHQQSLLEQGWSESPKAL